MSKTHTTAKGMLFDMDGTLLDSTPAVNATWDYFATEYDLDLHEVLKTSHGTRTIDNLRKWCGLNDQAELEEATELFESMIVTEAQRLQSEGKTGLELLPGVLDLLGELDKAETPVWLIVTSGKSFTSRAGSGRGHTLMPAATIVYASNALPTAGVPKPPKLITANDVTQGKPHPEPYLTGAKALNLDIKDCIVIEDAPSGIRSGVASGARVLAVCTSHTREKVTGYGATWIVTDLSKVKASLQDGVVHLDIDES